MTSSFDPIVQAARELLLHSPAAEKERDYLNSRLLPAQQEQFQFGYFPPVQHFSLLTNSLDQSTLKTLQLYYDYTIKDAATPRLIQHSFFEDHTLIMPYHDSHNQIVGLVGRSLLDDATRHINKIVKYKNTFFSKANHLFGLNFAKSDILKKDFVYLVEGQFDVIKAFERGITNIVALGNSNLTMQQLALLTRYTKNIFLLLDNDKAGETGRARAKEMFGHLANFNSVYLPSGYKDLDEYLQDRPGDELQLTVKNIKLM